MCDLPFPGVQRTLFTKALSNNLVREAPASSESSADNLGRRGDGSSS